MHQAIARSVRCLCRHLAYAWLGRQARGICSASLTTAAADGSCAPPALNGRAAHGPARVTFRHEHGDARARVTAQITREARQLTGIEEVPEQVVLC